MGIKWLSTHLDGNTASIELAKVRYALHRLPLMEHDFFRSYQASLWASKLNSNFPNFTSGDATSAYEWAQNFDFNLSFSKEDYRLPYSVFSSWVGTSNDLLQKISLAADWSEHLGPNYIGGIYHNPNIASKLNYGVLYAPRSIKYPWEKQMLLSVASDSAAFYISYPVQKGLSWAVPESQKPLDISCFSYNDFGHPQLFLGSRQPGVGVFNCSIITLNSHNQGDTGDGVYNLAALYEETVSNIEPWGPPKYGVIS